MPASPKQWLLVAAGQYLPGRSACSAGTPWTPKQMPHPLWIHPSCPAGEGRVMSMVAGPTDNSKIIAFAQSRQLTRRGATKEESVRRFSGGTAGPWVAATTTTVSPETTSLTSPLKKPAILKRLPGDQHAQEEQPQQRTYSCQHRSCTGQKLGSGCDFTRSWLELLSCFQRAYRCLIFRVPFRISWECISAMQLSRLISRWNPT